MKSIAVGALEENMGNYPKHLVPGLLAANMETLFSLTSLPWM